MKGTTMFGKKKTTAAPKPLSETTNTDESVHIFDQTNGVMRQFDLYTAEDHRDSNAVNHSGVAAAAIGGAASTANTAAWRVSAPSAQKN